MGTGMGAGGGGRFTVAVEAAASNIFQALIHLCIIIIELSVSNSICNLVVVWLRLGGRTSDMVVTTGMSTIIFGVVFHASETKVVLRRVTY
ncbi:uncharacterized protein PG998_012321 [Apiospora kogelbergensis]|uniref:uncharacterized protein n=1 Tax=Apiospora kogelbergensis TaxID=1337665 RepID=UPI003131A19A